MIHRRIREDYGTFCGSRAGGTGFDYPAGKEIFGAGGRDYLRGISGKSAASGLCERRMQHLRQREDDAGIVVEGV